MRVKVTNISEWSDGGIQVNLQALSADQGSVTRLFTKEQRADSPEANNYVVGGQYEVTLSKD